MSQFVRPKFSALAVLFTLLASLTVVAVAPSQAGAETPRGPFTFDPTNREDVRRLYYRVHQSSEGVPIGWTGSIDPCVPGTVSDDFLAATLTRINYFRAMAGVPSDTVFTAANNARAQATALIMSAQRDLSHNPPPTWRCWSQLGLDGASSNLAIGNTGPRAIDQLMLDRNAVELGHRRTILNPQTIEMGSGSIPDHAGGPAAEAQFMADNPSTTVRPARDGFVAWPPRGFVPYQVVFPQWHISQRGADFSAATVTMTRNGAPVATTITSRADWAGPGLVWRTAVVPVGSDWPRPQTDETFSVTVGNVLVGGTPRTLSYDVTVFDPALADPARTPLRVTGPVAPPTDVAARFSANAIPNATGYQWRTTKLTPLTLADGAETGLANFVAAVDLYDTVSTINAATGTASFRLTTGQPRSPGSTGRQTLTLNRTIVPTATSVLSFKSRGVGLANVTAVAEVSADDGQTWTPIHTEPATTSATFSDRVASLAAFADQQVQLRFRSENTGTGGTSCCGTEGWYIDDISLVNSFSAVPEVADLSPQPTFVVTPADATLLRIDVRPQFFGSGFGAWSPSLRVAPVAPVVAPTITAQPVAATAEVGGAATFAVTATGTAPLAFRWTRNGVDLVDGPGVVGAATASLRLSALTVARAGTYAVRVSNAAGPVTSGPATLTVTAPTPPPAAMSLASVLDNVTFTWSTSGNAAWTGQTITTRDGVDAARSGVITHSQRSTLQAAEVRGPATVTFSWRVESEARFDFLTVELDGVAPFPGISGTVDWEQRTITVPEGLHTIQWHYSKDGSVSTGQDAGWVDQVTVTADAAPPPGAGPDLSAALDIANAVTSTGDTKWTAQTAVTRDGVDAARSGVITHGQTSRMETTVTGPATLSFAWRVDSEARFDFLTVELDGVAPFPGISGSVDWEPRTIAIPAGTHTVRWSYTKDGSVSTGLDAGWVDQVTVGAAAAPPPPAPGLDLAAALDTTAVVTSSAPGAWTAQTAVSRDRVDAARSGVITHNETSRMEMAVTGPATVSFWWRVESESGFDFLTAELDGVAPFAGISGSVDWQQRTITVPAGTHTVRWIYTKDGSVSTGQDAGWVDQVVRTAS